MAEVSRKRHVTDLLDLREAVISAVRNVVRELPAIGEISAKAGELTGDVVTNVDHHLQREIAARLKALWPEAGCVGEEGFDGVPDPLRPFWIIDPLDGTLNFASGLSFYGVSIALIVDGYPALGVVFDLCTETVYDAVHGRGARRNGTALQWDERRAMNSPVGISSGFLAFAVRGSDASLLNAVRSLLGDRWRILGSQALQLCLAADGALKVNISREAKIWDDAAGYLVCREAGVSYALVGGGELFPIAPDGDAATGASLFSMAGTPDLVRRAVSLVQAHVNGMPNA